MRPQPDLAVRPLTRRTFLATGAAVATAPLWGRVPAAMAASVGSGSREGLDPATTLAFGFPEPDMTSQITKDITFPHEGVRDWTDTYGACRDGCSRVHEGQDLMGDKLRKLVACVDATIVELRHRSDGNALYLQGDDGWYYAYLHINNDSPGTDDGANPIEWAFAPGMAIGVKVRRGQHVAYMGDSGNAESTAPHCHFEIRKPADIVWHAQAVNPKYSLLAAKPPPPVVPPEAYTPWDNAGSFIHQQYLDVFGRDPDPVALYTFVDTLQRGVETPSWLVQQLVESDEGQSRNGAVLRLYRAFFDRTGDSDGYVYWLTKLRDGLSLGGIAALMARTREFAERYGALSNAAFVDAVYRNVLGHAADPSGRTFWIDQLDRQQVSRSGLVVQFSESTENREQLHLPVNVTIVHAAMLQRMPSEETINRWYYRVASPGGSLGEMIDTLRTSSEYKGRFA